MQINATELFVSGGGQVISTERPGDGLFDALLRAEEARYEEEYPRDPLRGQEDRNARERHAADHPDDFRSDDDRADRHGDDDRADDVRSERAGEGDSDDFDPPTHDEELGDRQGGRSDRDDEWAESDPSAEKPAAPANQQDGTASEVTASAESQEPKNGGMAGEKTSPEGTAADQQSAMAGTGSLPGVANQAATAAGVATPMTTWGNQAAGTAAAAPVAGQSTPEAAARGPSQTEAVSAAPAKAAVQQATADNAKPKAAAGNPMQTAPSPSGDQDNGNASAAANAKPTPEGLVVTAARANLTSRPSAALGGAATTAAMAQGTRSDSAATNDSKRTKPLTGESSNSAVKEPHQSGAPKAMPAATPNASVSAGKTEQPVAAAGAAGRIGIETLNLGSSGGQGQTSLPLGGTLSGGSVQNATFSDALNTARANGAPAPAEQIAVQVQKAQLAGKDQLNIKLHPAELGRIEVKLENGDDGVLRAVISAERGDTLDLLQRDVRGLERALQDAGVKTDSGSLSFNLKGQQHQAREGTTEHDTGQATQADDKPDGPAAAPSSPNLSPHDGALDIRV